MKKMIRKAAVFNSYDFDYKEDWLNEMAAEGYLLAQDGAFVCRFEASDNHSRRYCIIPKDDSDLSQEELDLYQEQGWFLLSGRAGTSIFYTDETDAPDLFTDEQSYRSYLAKSMRSLLRNFFLCLAFALIWAFNLYISLPGGQMEGLYGLTDRTMGLEISYFVMALLIVGFYTAEGIARLRARRRILQGIRREYRKSTYLRKRLTGWWTYVLVVLIIAAAGSSLFNGDEMDIQEAMAYQGDSPAMFKEFSPEEWDFVSAHTDTLPAEEKAAQYDYELRHVTNTTLREGSTEDVWPKEYTGYDYFELPEYYSMTCDFRKEKTAVKMLNRQIGIDMNQSTNPQRAEKSAAEIEVAVSKAEADYVGYYDERDAEGYGWQYLYLRKGTKVVYASYKGSRDLMDAFELFADQL